MSRYIDADILMSNHSILAPIAPLIDGDTVHYEQIVFTDNILNFPAADVVEVIRCKNCMKREYCRTSNVWAVTPNDDWFCADAERRTDER